VFNDLLDHYRYTNTLWPLHSFFQARPQNCEKGLSATPCLSVRLSTWINSATTGWIVMALDILVEEKNKPTKCTD